MQSTIVSHTALFFKLFLIFLKILYENLKTAPDLLNLCALVNVTHGK